MSEEQSWWECPMCPTPKLVSPAMLVAHVSDCHTGRPLHAYVCTCGARSTCLAEIGDHVLTSGHPAVQLRREDNWFAFRSALKDFQLGLEYRKAELADHNYQKSEKPAPNRAKPEPETQPSSQSTTNSPSQPSIRLSIPAVLISNLLSARNQEANAERKRPGADPSENDQVAKKTIRPGVFSLWGSVIPPGLATDIPSPSLMTPPIQPPNQLMEPSHSPVQASDPTMQPHGSGPPCYYPPIKTEVDADIPPPHPVIKGEIKEESDATTANTHQATQL